VLFDQSVRLEPTQVAGFNQAFRSLIPESVVGLVPGTRFETFGVGLDHAFASRTYAGVEAEWLQSSGSRVVGVLTNSMDFLPISDGAGSTRQDLDYDELSVRLTAHQLIGAEWSLGVRYEVSEADLDSRFPEIPGTAANVEQIDRATEGVLHQLDLQADYSHRCGFFSRAWATWRVQHNRGYYVDMPGDNFWQFHLMAGYRWPRRLAELRVALLNLTDQDYELNPLNLHRELPRERTLSVALRLNF
jgi:hypothetical protein